MPRIIKASNLYFVDHVLRSHGKNVNDVNIFILKYKYLELAMEATNQGTMLTTRGSRGHERVNPLFPSVILRTILNFLVDFQLCCKRVVRKYIHEINGAWLSVEFCIVGYRLSFLDP